MKSLNSLLSCYAMALLLGVRPPAVVLGNYVDSGKRQTTATTAVAADAAASKKEVAEAEQCSCPDWPDAIRDKVVDVEALSTSAKEKVLSSLSSMERLEDALFHAATNAQKVTTLHAKNEGLAQEMAQVLDQMHALKMERETLKQKASELKDQVEGLTTDKGNLQVEASHLREELTTLKEQVRSYKSKEVNAKNDQERLVRLEAERSKLDSMLHKEIEQVSLLSGKARECQILVETMRSELSNTKEASESHLNALQSKQNESQRRFKILKDEVALKEKNAGKHYCNATAMRLDLDAKVIEVHSALKSRLKPHVEQGLVQGRSVSIRVLNQMRSQYNLHLKEHVEQSILPPYREHLAPYVVTATKQADEGMAKLYLFLVDSMMNVSHFCLNKIKYHETSEKGDVPAWLKDALEYATSNPVEFVQLYLKAAGASVVVFLFWNLICSCFLGPLFAIIGCAVYISIEVPFHLVWFVGGSLKSLGEQIRRRTIKGKNLPTLRRPPQGCKSGKHAANKGKSYNAKGNSN